MSDLHLLSKSSNREICWSLHCINCICNTIVGTHLLLWKNSLGSDKKTRLPIQQHWRSVRCFPSCKKKHSENISHCCNCFVLCWSNNKIYYILDHLGFHANWNGTYYKFTVLMVFLNCTVNQFIYLINYQESFEIMFWLSETGRHRREKQ